MKITRHLLFLCSMGPATTLATASLAQETDSNDSPEAQPSASAEPSAPSTPPSDPVTENPTPPSTIPEEVNGEGIGSSKPMLTAMLVLLGIAFVYFMTRASRKLAP
ncbi:MAG: hypothetical protein CMJ96_02250 [Planctomycetes bacterium]|nr:hypothetical protein [Planctomycetota bacterium]